MGRSSVPDDADDARPVSGLAGTPTEQGHFRPDIEGMRAIAILAVLVYHMGVSGFPGGFVGVDVFYVISGFLITGLLRRELVATGRISLSNFYARRLRRLLPAALAVIGVTVAASWFLLSSLRFPDVAADGAAASLYVSNYRFALNATDYLAAADAPSPLLHYWSLAVEEQFYLVWPLLIMVGARLISVRRLGWLVLLVGVSSLVVSFVLTDVAAPWAFFSLPTRAWELAIGAGVALGILRLPRVVGPRGAAIAGWLGLAMVLGSVLLIDGSMPFPGVVALVPVCGAALLIASGEPTAAGSGTAGDRFRAFAPSRFLGTAVPRWFGRISYSLYLWHWPILILGAIALGNSDLWVRMVLGAVGIGVAALSTRFVEAPFRVHGRPRAPRRSVALAGVASVALAVAALAAGGLLPFGPSTPGAVAVVPRPSSTPRPSRLPTATPAAGSLAAPSPKATAGPPTPRHSTAPGSSSAPTPTTSGPTPQPTPEATSVPPEPPLPDPVESGPLPADLTPSLAQARNDLPSIYNNGCRLDVLAVDTPDCVFGDVNSSTTVVLFGDSHAAQWFPALEPLAEQRGWRLLVLTKSACPATDVTVWLAQGYNRVFHECDTWRSKALARIAAEQPAIVFVGSAHDYDLIDSSGHHPVAQMHDAWRQGYIDVLTALRGDSPRVVVLADTPYHAADPLECLASKKTIEACPDARSDMVDPAYTQLEADAAQVAGAEMIDATDWLCGATTCPPVMGNYLVYRDEHHMTATFAALLTDRLGWALDQLP